MGKAQKIGIGIAAVIVVFLIVVVTRPSTYHVERSKVISAPATVVYGHIADFRKWESWSPWEKLDPQMKKTYEGTPGTVGSAYSWDGKGDAGAGTMTVKMVDPNKRLDIKLEFVKPFESVAKTGFILETAGNQTKVSWFIDGDNDFMGKIMSLFMDMDKMIGKDFEKGLDEMKKISESAPAPAAAN
jgi:hypothetical protein